MAETTPPQDEPELHLEIVYGANMVAFFDGDGEPIAEPLACAPPRLKAVERAAEMYLAAGPGYHPITTSQQMQSFEALGRVMPGQTLRYPVSDGELPASCSPMRYGYAYFGNLAIRGRMADEAEITEARHQRTAQAKASARRQHELLIAADAEKSNFTDFDHVLITVGSRAYFMNLDMQPAFFAFRILQKLKAMPAHEDVDLAELSRAVWNAMPTAERELLPIIKGKTLTRTINDMTRLIVVDLARQLGITRAGGMQYQRTSEALELQLHLLPDAYSYEGKATLIMPPGSRKPTTESSTKQGAELQEYGERLQEFIQADGWSRSEALDVLDIIMNKKGKRALLNLFASAHGGDADRQIAQAEAALERLHRRARWALGYEGYFTARRNRTIAGNHATGAGSGAVQIGGRLRGDLTKDEEIKRWSIGEPQTLKSGRMDTSSGPMPGGRA